MEATNSQLFLFVVAGILGLLVMVLTIFFFALYHNRKILQEKLRRKEQETEANEKMLRMALDSQENERKRISKDIHDGVGVMLQALRNTVHTITKGASEVDRKEMQTMMDGLTETVRSISWDLMPTTLERFGLVSAVEEFCQRMGVKTTVPISFTQKGTPLPLDMNQQLLLYRIVQEALNNAVQHAQASQINVNLEWKEGCLQLEVMDDGIGFDYSPGLKFRNTFRLGLSNLETRARLLHAELQFGKNKPSGCVLTLKLPVYVG